MKTDNELIAEFMNYPVIQEAELAICRIIKTPHGEVNVHDLLFDSSWNWLMPVVEKINKMTPDIFNYNAQAMTEFRLIKNEVQMLQITTPIEIVYNSVVEFAKWYKSQNPKP